MAHRIENQSQNRGRDLQPAPNSGLPALPEQGSGIGSDGVFPKKAGILNFNPKDSLPCRFDLA